MDAVQEFLTPDQICDFERKVPIVMKAGYASFHHPIMMHGSFENHSPFQRRATVINVFGKGVVSNLDFESVNSPGSNNYPSVPMGQRMEGTYYPLLFDPKKESKTFGDDIPNIKSLRT